MDNDAKNWLEYITKINDRQISKQQASGLTTWAILGLVGVIIFKLFDKLTLLNNNKNVFLLLIFIITIFDLTFVIIGFYGYIKKTINYESTRRLWGNISIRITYIIEIIISILTALISVANFYIAQQCGIDIIMAWPYYFFGVTIILSLLYLFAEKIITLIFKSKKYSIKGIEYLDLISSSRPASFWDVAFPLLFMVISFTSIRNLFTTGYIQNVNILKASFEVYVLIILIVYLIIQNLQSIKYDWLSDLEKRILVEGINMDEISAIFVKEYLGEKPVDFIEKELTIRYTNILLKYQEIDSLLQEFESACIGCNSSVNRLRELLRVFEKTANEYFVYNQNKIKEIKMLSPLLIIPALISA
jgi:hypothetical protein